MNKPNRTMKGTGLRRGPMAALVATALVAGPMAWAQNPVIADSQLGPAGLKLAAAAAGRSGTNAAVGPRDPTVPSASLAAAMQNSQGQAGAPGVPMPPPPPPAKVEVKESTTNAPPYEKVIALADFQGANFGDAARAISDATGLNIAPTANASSTKVSVLLRELSVKDVLETVCNSHNLWFRRDERTGVVRVYTAQEFKQDLASFREEKTEVFTLLYPNAFDIAHSIQDLYGARVRVSYGDSDSEMIDDLENRFTRFDLLDARRETTSVLSGIGGANGNNGMNGGQAGVGGAGAGAGGFGGGGNAMNQRSMQMGARRQQQGTANQVRPVAPLPESQNLSVEQMQTLAAARESGASEDQKKVADVLERRVTIFVTVLRRQNKLLVRSADEAAVAEIRELVRKLDVPMALVLLEVKVLGIQLDDGFNSSFDYAVNDPRFGGSFNLGEINHPTYVPKFKDDVSGQVVTPDANFNPGGAGFNQQGFVFQYLGDKVRARLNVLESKNKVTTLSTPVILTANGEVSRIFVGEERPLNRGFRGGQTVSSSGGNVTTGGEADLEFRPVGTTLLITPSINSDRTLTLRLVQENSSIDPQAATVLVPQGNGFVERKLDTVRARAISGTVVAQDRSPLAVGGLIEEGMSDQRAGVPILSKIPILGAAFRRDNRTRGRREVVLLMRPFIISTPSEAEAISRDLMQQISINPQAAAMGFGTDLKTYGTNDVLVPTPPKSKKKDK